MTVVKARRDGPNTLVFRKVTVRFRSHPGTDSTGALGRMTYVIRSGIAAVAGLTKPDGSVTLRVPSGGAARLEIFGSVFEIGAAGPLPSASDPEGARRRLAMLGYRPEPELAALDFQADHGLDPKGLDASGGLDAATRGKLESEIGV
jgi:hypothetical protein